MRSDLFAGGGCNRGTGFLYFYFPAASIPDVQCLAFRCPWRIGEF
ncbi:MAG: hypothetical protein K0S45_1159 [Nitrospira sp.]|jgi:hypothetical protein|nr:hypothetical protein [Nitrospira sp.]